jgi:hypothetical protein
VALIGILGILRRAIGATWERPIPAPRGSKAVTAVCLPLGENAQGFLRAVHRAPSDTRFLRLGLNIFGWARPIAEKVSKKLLGLCLGWPVARIFVGGKDLVSSV